MRNFESLQKGLKEIYRVLIEKGMVVILEPSSPSYFPIKQFHHIYFNYILPKIGAWISKDKRAYSYLPSSVEHFPSGDKFINELKKAGFKKCRHIPLTFGIVSMYVAIK